MRFRVGIQEMIKAFEENTGGAVRDPGRAKLKTPARIDSGWPGC